MISRKLSQGGKKARKLKDVDEDYRIVFIEVLFEVCDECARQEAGEKFFSEKFAMNQSELLTISRAVIPGLRATKVRSRFTQITKSLVMKVKGMGSNK